MGRVKRNKELSVRTCALVLGDLGTVGTFRASIKSLKLLDDCEIESLTHSQLSVRSAVLCRPNPAWLIGEETRECKVSR